MRQFFSPLIFIIHTPLQIASLAVWASLVIVFRLVKLLLPFPLLQQGLADIPLVYPDNQRHPMVSMLGGQLTRGLMDVNVLDVPAESCGDFYIDDQFREQFHAWLNDLWAAKDARFARWMEQKL